MHVNQSLLAQAVFKVAAFRLDDEGQDQHLQISARSLLLITASSSVNRFYPIVDAVI